MRGPVGDLVDDARTVAGNPALSVRAALDRLRRDDPGSVRTAGPMPADAVAADYAGRFAGVPATAHARDEPAVRYAVTGGAMPVLLGLYGAADRVRGWLPGLPARPNPRSVRALLDGARPPVTTTDPPCQEAVTRTADLDAVPILRATPRDAGRYVTLGVVHAVDPVTGEQALSVHRMIVLGADRLTIWMVPGRALGRLHAAAVARGGRLPVSVNIGAPPAAVIASALSTAVLPAGTGKLAVAGALAGAPVRLAAARTQPVPVLADSELVLEGHLDGTTADEGPEGPSMPEFLGYDGTVRHGLPVLTVTAVTSRRDPCYQAVIGPGREQSVVLGLAGDLSVALTADDGLVTDVHHAAAGGGMLLLAVAVEKSSPADDARLAGIARRVFARHGFVKLIVFTDSDVDIRCAEDLLWAITTRANLGADATTFGGFAPLPVDPSQSPEWTETRGGAAGRTFVDATVPFALRHTVVRSFPGARP
ncbi:UbiD family decarboxylase domain-containing protein [Actinophytocola sp. KF-1]